MRYITAIYLTLACTLSACDMAGHGFRGLTATRIQIGEMHFTMRAAGDQVEAIRTNTMARPRMDRVSFLAGSAIEAMTGCRVHKIGGDVAVVLAELKCPRGRDLSALALGRTYRCLPNGEQGSSSLCHKLD